MCFNIHLICIILEFPARIVIKWLALTAPLLSILQLISFGKGNSYLNLGLNSLDFQMFILIFSRRFPVVVRSFINFTDDKSLFTRNGICQNIGKLTVLNYRKDFRINTIQKRFPFNVIFQSHLKFWSFHCTCTSALCVRPLN